MSELTKRRPTKIICDFKEFRLNEPGYSPTSPDYEPNSLKSPALTPVKPKYSPVNKITNNMNTLQQKAHDAVINGQSVFLTGCPGTGKTFCLNNIIKTLLILINLSQTLSVILIKPITKI